MTVLGKTPKHLLRQRPSAVQALLKLCLANTEPTPRSAHHGQACVNTVLPH